MPAQLDPNKAAVDFGIAISDSEATLRFYRDTLGLTHVMDMPMPAGVAGSGTMHRIACGATTLKFVRLDKLPEEANRPGGPATSTGLRYLTIWVTNLDEIIEECRSAGYPILFEPATIRPGVRIAFVEDPDKIWVELLENTAA